MNAPRPGALDALDDALRDLLARVRREAARRRHALYLVGGPVRDWLLGRSLRDLDLLVVARPEEGAALARAAVGSRGEVEIHARFGTARLAREGASLDLATARREHYARPGALPTVEPGSLEEDLGRRDFTVNAMALALSGEGPSTACGDTSVPDLERLVDLAGGREDLARGVLRVLHPRSFFDDPTRALRAARLAARFGFRLARATRNALRAAIDAGAFDEVSGERVRRELEHLFDDDPRLGGDPVRALVALERWELLEALRPGLVLPRPARAPLRRLGRVVAQPPWPLETSHPWVAALALWCEGLRAPARRALLERLSVRGRRAELVLRFARDARRDLERCERARGRGALDRELGALAPEVRLAIYAKAGAPLRQRITRWVREDRGRRPPVGGRDFDSLGLEGAQVGEGLAAVRAAWLDGKFAGRAEALTFAAEWARRARRRARNKPRNSPRRGR